MKQLSAAARIGGFLLLLALLLTGISKVVERKDSHTRMDLFFTRAPQTDVLLLGDSMVLNGVYPQELWNRFGITAYNMACFNDTLPVEYWTLMNCLDYGTPKVVVIGVKDVNDDKRVSRMSGNVHDAFDAFPLTLTKARALFDLMANSDEADHDGVRYSDQLIEFLFPLAKYHGRWSELTDADLHPAQGVQLGAEQVVRVFNPDDYTILEDVEPSPEEGRGYFYLRKMIEECQNRGIQVILMEMPHPSDEETQAYDARVQLIAEEYNITFCDFVRMDAVVEYKIDCQDPKTHLNPSGGRKVTAYLGDMLANDGLQDHRADPAYAAWNAGYEAYLNYKADLFAQQEDYKAALMLLHDPDFDCVISVKKGVRLNKNKLYELLQNVCRRDLTEADIGSTSSAEECPLSEIDYALENQEAYLLVTDRAQDGFYEQSCGGWAEVQQSWGTVQYWRDDAELEITLVQDGQSTTYFTTEEEQEADLCVLAVDRRTGKPCAGLHFDIEKK